MTDLPGVDWTGVTPAQKAAALEAMRGFDCTCGCPMKVAQCRVEDPPCSQSNSLAAIAVAAAKANKPAAAIKQEMENSQLARQAKQANRVLQDPVPLSIAGAPVKGPASARITIVEFSDFQCPYCGKAVKQLDELLAAFPKDVRLVFKQFPLSTHPKARIAGAASLSAHAQGKFWPMHDRLFANHDQLGRESFLLWAKEIGLDMPKFIAVMDATATAKQVDTELAEGEKVGVDATPTIFINGQRYQGSLALNALGPVIQQELKGK